MIREITLKNFKSFTDITFNFLGKNNKPHSLVLIYGANGSGKTNFVEALRFLNNTFNTFDLQSALEKILEDDKETINPAVLKKAIDENNIGSLIKKAKTIGSTSNMVIEFSFLWHDKVGEYYIEFDDEQLIRERLEYAHSKNKTVFFDISLDSEKYNPSVFTGDYMSELKDKKNKYWGKHSLISILYGLRRDYSKQFSQAQFNESLSDVLNFFSRMPYRLVDPNSRIGNIGYFNCLLANYSEGKISSNEINRLKQTELLLNGYFTSLYKDIKKVFYDIKPTDDDQLKYILYFKKMISNNCVDVKFRQESCGTRCLLELLPFFVAVNHDITAAIDEVDNGIHDYLLEKLIMAIAPSIHGQLILTTHNTLFLEKYELKDNIYIIDVNSDGYKTVKALSENNFRVQKSSNVLSNYYDGQFGGIPKINPDFDFDELCKYSYS